MHIIVPFDAETPKTRLEPVLSHAERKTFANAMLLDVLTAISNAGYEPTVLATTSVELTPVTDLASVIVDERPLTPAVNAQLNASSGSVAVIMSDLALITPETVTRLISCQGDVVIAPGRGCGTNALMIRHPEFKVDYHGTSYIDHREIAREVGAQTQIFDSFRLATDIDEPEDLTEILVHDGSQAAHCLQKFGFELDVSEGRVKTVRGNNGQDFV
ncbi:2-phospho-L-lactate guanylyltransferase [Natrialbaceae archaeon A-chndr2]